MSCFRRAGQPAWDLPGSLAVSPTLYTTPLSANGRKPLVVAKLLAIELHIVEVDVYRGDGQHPNYRAIHPQGKVPALVDDTFHLWESNAIAWHLATQLAPRAQQLVPPGPNGPADVLRWMFWEASQWQPALVTALAARVGQKLFATPGDPQPVDWECVDKLVTQLEGHLATRPWLVGQQLTLADICVGAMTTYFSACAFPRRRYPAVSQWLDRLAMVPAWRATLAPLWADEQPVHINL